MPPVTDPTVRLLVFACAALLLSTAALLFAWMGALRKLREQRERVVDFRECARTWERTAQGWERNAMGWKRVAELQNPLDAVLYDVVEWARLAFGRARTPQRHRAKAIHLLKEAQELAEDPSDAEEMADVLMILAHLAADQGVNLAVAVREKLAVCRQRQWGPPDADGVVEHVRKEDGADLLLMPDPAPDRKVIEPPLWAADREHYELRSPGPRGEHG